MPRPASAPAKVSADSYATRAVLIVMLKALRGQYPGTIPAIRGYVEHGGAVKPDDVGVQDAAIRHSVEMILNAAEQG